MMLLKEKKTLLVLKEEPSGLILGDMSQQVPLRKEHSDGQEYWTQFA
jgi:hypothetical protein